MGPSLTAHPRDVDRRGCIATARRIDGYRLAGATPGAAEREEV